MKTSGWMARALWLAVLAIPGAVIAEGAEDEDVGRIDAARFTDDGKLIAPADLEEWVHLGSSYAMGYNEASFDPEAHNMFQIVKMEPAAFRYFVENGEYAEGSMFLLAFYGSKTKLANNRTGFVMGDPMNYEIHLKDSAAFEDGRAFYLYNNGDESAKVLPPGNDCVTCHEKDGAFDGTFAQFYPPIRTRIPVEMLEKSLRKGGEGLTE